jgi:glutaredoxin 3
MKNLTLYILNSCPYCQKVLNYLTEKSITVLIKLTGDDANREELIKIGGKKQVPCLVIDGKALYESNDIIAWFKENYPT